jgi:hypothetical protein
MSIWMLTHAKARSREGESQILTTKIPKSTERDVEEEVAQ